MHRTNLHSSVLYSTVQFLPLPGVPQAEHSEGTVPYCTLLSCTVLYTFSLFPVFHRPNTLKGVSAEALLSRLEELGVPCRPAEHNPEFVHVRSGMQVRSQSLSSAQKRHTAEYSENTAQYSAVPYHVGMKSRC